VGFWSDLFVSWPKRLPEGYVKTLHVGRITVFLCGKKHPVLDKQGRAGAVIWCNNYVFLRGYRRRDGKLTIKPKDGWKVAGHEFQHLLNYADKEIINPDLEM